MTGSQYAMQALEGIFRHPIFRATDFGAMAGIPAPTARRILMVLRENGILRELRADKGRRVAILAFPALLDVCGGERRPLTLARDHQHRLSLTVRTPDPIRTRARWPVYGVG